jgi:hypothetical protein
MTTRQAVNGTNIARVTAIWSRSGMTMHIRSANFVPHPAFVLIAVR